MLAFVTLQLSFLLVGYFCCIDILNYILVRFFFAFMIHDFMCCLRNVFLSQYHEDIMLIFSYSDSNLIFFHMKNQLFYQYLLNFLSFHADW